MSEGMIDANAAARFINVTPKELQSLVANGVIQKNSGKFHPVQLVHSYVNHIRGESERLLNSPTQAEISKHLSMSERNLRDVLRGLNIDHKTYSLDEIRDAYIKDLREKAAGRGGDEQQSLTKARTREAQINTQTKELEYFTKVGLLVPVDEIEPILQSWAVLARSEVMNALDKVTAFLESKHGIEIEQGLIDDSLGAAFTAIADYPRNNSKVDGEGSKEVGAAA